MTPQNPGSVDYPSTRGTQVEVGLPDATLENRAESPLYGEFYPITKETLPDFLKWRRVTRPPLVFRGLTGSQRTPGFWDVTAWYQSLGIRIPRELGFEYPSPLGWFGIECRCGSLEMEAWA